MWMPKSLAVHFFSTVAWFPLLSGPGQSLAMCPGFQHLKQDPDLINFDCSSGVKALMSIALGSHWPWFCVWPQGVYLLGLLPFPWFMMACAIQKFELYWIAFLNHLMIVVRTLSAFMIHFAKGRFRASWNSLIRWRWSEGEVCLRLAYSASNLNSVTSSSAGLFPCLIMQSLFIASPVLSAGLKASAMWWMLHIWGASYLHHCLLLK